jgi:hypothetical protein
MSAADYAGLQAKGEKGRNRSAINRSFSIINKMSPFVQARINLIEKGALTFIHGILTLIS